MNDGSKASRRHRRKWIWAAILVVLAGVLLVPLAGEFLPYHGNLAANIADVAAWAGVRRLATELQSLPVTDGQIAAEMLDYAAHTGLEEGDQLTGYYLDADCGRLAPMGSGIPQDARGIEAVVTVRVRIFGVAIWLVTRERRMCFDPAHADNQGTPTIQLRLPDD